MPIMTRLFLIIVEVLLGVAVAAVLLAIAVPVLIRRGLFAPGDALGSLVVGLVVVVCVAAMILRPGSAFRRREDR